MGDKENVAPGRNQPTITQKYKSVKRKLEGSEEENKRLKTELAEANAKLESIKKSNIFKELAETAKNLSPPIYDVFNGLAPAPPVLHAENPVRHYIFQGRTNPLEMDVVLLKVFSNLGGKELATCRLVNSIWKSNASFHLKGTHTPILLRNSRTIAQFAKTMEHTNEFPYSSFMIKNEFGSRFATKFESFAGHVKVLKLVGKNFTGGGKMPEMTLSNISNILRVTPNLEKLELDGFGFVDGSVPDEGFIHFEMTSLKQLTLGISHYDIFLSLEKPGALHNAQAVLRSLQRIFSATPVLTALKLQVFGRRLLHILLPLVAQLNNLRKLEFGSCFPESHLECLATGVLRLTSVKIVVHLVDCQLLQDFLTSQAETLRSLELHFSTSNAHPMQSVTFPAFPYLNYLKLISDSTEQWAPFQRKVSGNEFPVLQHLWVTSDFLSHSFLTRIPMPGVTSLTCSVQNPLRLGTYVDLAGVQELFPNLKKIHIIAPGPGMKGIFKNTANFLEHLVIDVYDGDQLRIGTTLIGNLDSSVLAEEFQRLNETPAVTRRIVTNFFSSSPNVGILEMKKLKRLEICCSDEDKLTDVSGYIALLSLHPLEYLAIYNSNLSETCIEELRKVHKTVAIKTLPKTRPIRTSIWEDEHANH